MTSSLERPPIAAIVRRHAEDSAHLRHVRSRLIRSGQVRLFELGRHDERIAAHLDGLAVAGDEGVAACVQALAEPGRGVVFAAAVLALEGRDERLFEQLLGTAATSDHVRRGLRAAVGWVSASRLRGTVHLLLTSTQSDRRELGLAASRLHGTDPGNHLRRALTDGPVPVRCEAMRCAGEHGLRDVLATVLEAIDDAHPAIAARAAITAYLIGDRGRAAAALERLAVDPTKADAGVRDEACSLLLAGCEFLEGRQVVRRLAQSRPVAAALQRRVIRACGWLGDAQFVPWLIDLMASPLHARIAGESFALITGADLVKLVLDRRAPDDAEGGPSDDPNDENVEPDADESLVWPDPVKVQRWWQAHAWRMPVDARSFNGAPPSVAHCTTVLIGGAQRQRFVAAMHLALLGSGRPLFPVCAPAWRQQRLLARMTS